MLKEKLPVKQAAHALVPQHDQRIGVKLLQRERPACQRREGFPADQDFVERHQINFFQLPLCAGGGRHNSEIDLAVFHSLNRLRR